ncbi:MAG: Phosphoribosylamine-glycine ligase [candidate division CPR2 bacterium GW2011_GWC1_41_48]|uniref:Phosphoribosylamine--glycine ligase n=1 Tax=candidate division CPR2 bacterium GW2011_GWC1_41_48 TaxID=1618344 RepID=A0A0G0YIR8_UNCC2|nr:MAG: Phosphoribosylamine-glycine ligase [candidate division CPR2 bacterium GW2011_GWC2_39_35]KKS09451.1 MAG: Phosphoribosylamine-glycine ligase [candidate division CPR2 bacterium GW2011_GWC1_41_48]
MRVLVVGSGGREHALTKKILESPEVSEVFVAPGNGGTREIAHNVDIAAADCSRLVRFAKRNRVGLTVVGPEVPLVLGIGGYFDYRSQKMFGPGPGAAMLEGSKNYAKTIMKRYGIPTGESSLFAEYHHAIDFLKKMPPPYVVKVDGLAGGKGVVVTSDLKEAEAAVRRGFSKSEYINPHDLVLIEECLEGWELSMLAFSDGRNILPLVPAQDYKRLDTEKNSPNTGGMGSYSPVPKVTPELYEEIIESILKPTITAMAKEGMTYKGIIYAGLMITEDGPKVIEFNCRFGDPETQAIIPRLESDIMEPMLAVVEGDLSGVKLKWKPEVCASVVIASGGYPGTDHYPELEIQGIDDASRIEGVTIYHAGTTIKDGEFHIAGGRVLNVSALGKDFGEARERAYEAVSKIKFPDMCYRTDIALTGI